MFIVFPSSSIYKQQMGCNSTILIFFSQNDCKLSKRKKGRGYEGNREEQKKKQVSSLPHGQWQSNCQINTSSWYRISAQKLRRTRLSHRWNAWVFWKNKTIKDSELKGLTENKRETLYSFLSDRFLKLWCCYSLSNIFICLYLTMNLW